MALTMAAKVTHEPSDSGISHHLSEAERLACHEQGEQGGGGTDNPGGGGGVSHCSLDWYKLTRP
jgi:hypothetical protein